MKTWKSTDSPIFDTWKPLTHIMLSIFLKICCTKDTLLIQEGTKNPQVNDIILIVTKHVEEILYSNMLFLLFNCSNKKHYQKFIKQLKQMKKNKETDLYINKFTG